MEIIRKNLRCYISLSILVLLAFKNNCVTSFTPSPLSRSTLQSDFSTHRHSLNSAVTDLNEPAITNSEQQDTSKLSSSTVTPGKTTKAQSDSQNIFGVLSDAFTGVVFSLLHAFDDCGIEDSSKNLRVLWVRALLNYRGKIQDDIAATFLPPTTRGLVTSESGAALLDPILKFAEWIQARTEFIDSSLDMFLSSPVCRDSKTDELRECNLVLFGAGYDTRALRYRHKHGGKIDFIEVDLPSVVEGKTKLYEKFQKEQDPDWDLQNRGSKLIPFDLNECGGDNPTSIIDVLRTQGKLKENVPTFLVSEAVLFYVNEDAVRNFMMDLFKFAKKGGNGESPHAETLLCFTGMFI